VAFRLPSLAPADSNEVLRPVRPWFVALTLIAALFGNLLPLSGTWCIQAPRYVGVGVAWTMGLLMDVGDATLFGQHALAYAVLAYAAEYFRRRVLRFPLWQQAVQVAALLAFCAGLVFFVRVFGGAPMPRLTFFVPALVGALLWPLMSVLLQLPQRPVRSTATL
jgi:rod shape-determining protein MreD